MKASKVFKRALSLFVVLALMSQALIYTAVAADEPMTFVVAMPEGTVNNNGTVDIGVYVENNPGFCGFNLHLNYDSEYFQPVVPRDDAGKANLLGSLLKTAGGFWQPNFTDSPTYINAIWARATNIYGDGLLFTIRFSAKSNVTLNKNMFSVEVDPDDKPTTCPNPRKERPKPVEGDIDTAVATPAAAKSFEPFLEKTLKGSISGADLEFKTVKALENGLPGSVNVRLESGPITSVVVPILWDGSNSGLPSGTITKAGTYTFTAEWDEYNLPPGVKAPVSIVPPTIDVVILQNPSQTPLYSINVVASAGGYANGGGLYYEGETVTLTASPVTDPKHLFWFLGWYEDDKIVSLNYEYIFTATATRTIEAKFTDVEPPMRYMITVISGEGGTADGSDVYDINESVTLTATPDRNKIFTGWYDKSDELVSTDNPYIFTPDDDYTFTAKFSQINFIVNNTSAAGDHLVNAKNQDKVEFGEVTYDEVSNNYNLTITGTERLEKYFSTDPSQNDKRYAWVGVLIGMEEIPDITKFFIKTPSMDGFEQLTSSDVDEAKNAGGEGCFVWWIKVTDSAEGSEHTIEIATNAEGTDAVSLKIKFVPFVSEVALTVTNTAATGDHLVNAKNQNMVDFGELETIGENDFALTITGKERLVAYESVDSSQAGADYTWVGVLVGVENEPDITNLWVKTSADGTYSQLTNADVDDAANAGGEDCFVWWIKATDAGEGSEHVIWIASDDEGTNQIRLTITFVPFSREVTLTAINTAATGDHLDNAQNQEKVDFVEIYKVRKNEYTLTITGKERLIPFESVNPSQAGADYTWVGVMIGVEDEPDVTNLWVKTRVDGTYAQLDESEIEGATNAGGENCFVWWIKVTDAGEGSEHVIDIASDDQGTDRARLTVTFVPFVREVTLTAVNTAAEGDHLDNAKNQDKVVFGEIKKVEKNDFTLTITGTKRLIAFRSIEPSQADADYTWVGVMIGVEDEPDVTNLWVKTRADGDYFRLDESEIEGATNAGGENCFVLWIKVTDSGEGSVHVIDIASDDKGTDNARLTITFVPFVQMYTITASGSAGGTVTGGGEYEEGKDVTLRATPNSGYSFNGWYENNVKVFDNSTYTFKATANRTLQARFIITKHTVTVNAGAGGTVTGGGEYEVGASVTLVAVPDSGYSFDGWYLDNVKVSGNSTYTLTVTGNSTLEARFTKNADEGSKFAPGGSGPNSSSGTPIKYKITVTAGIGGAVAGDGEYVRGTLVTLVATPELGYKFDGWYVGDTKLDAGATYSFSATGSKTLEARFTETGVNPPTLIVPVLDKSGKTGYISGYPDSTVKAGNSITRYEVAVIFYKLCSNANKALYASQITKFTDVSAGQWYSEAVGFLSAAGVISGYENGTFRGGNTITRAEFASIASKFSKLNLVGDVPFSDVQGHWALNAITTAYNNGWISGYPDGTFGPDRLITRAETAVIINKILGWDSKSVTDGTTRFSDLANSEWYFNDMVLATNGLS